MPASRKKTKTSSAKTATSKRSASKGSARKRTTGDRELLDTPRGGKRYIRREADGEFSENQDSVSRSLRQDVKKKAKKIVPAGQGDRGDQKARPAAKKRSSRGK